MYITFTQIITYQLLLNLFTPFLFFLNKNLFKNKIDQSKKHNLRSIIINNQGSLDRAPSFSNIIGTWLAIRYLKAY